MRVETAITNGILVQPRLGTRGGTIAISGGRITGILDPGQPVDAAETIDAAGLHVFPGLIDPHMHIGFVGQPLTDVASETRSAAIGGVTSILNYVLKPDDYAEPFREFVDHIERLALVDMGIHFGIFTEEQIAAIPRYIADHGVTSFKFFMPYKGDEGTKRGLVAVDLGILEMLLRELRRHPGTIANVHAENIEMIWRYERRARDAGLDGLSGHNAARPGFAEAADVNTAAWLARRIGAPIYFVHLSSRESIREIARHRDEPRAFVETAPHYLSLTVDSPCGLLAKVNPPVREQADDDALWEAVRSGLVDTIGNDHSARFRSEKEGGLWKAGAAFPGVGTMLAVLLTEGHHARGIPLERIAEITSFNTARIFGLPAKGRLEPGADADLALVDLDQERTVDPAYLGSRADFSPWEGQRLRGWAVRTLVRGVTVMRDGQIVGREGHGRYLRRSLPPAP